LPDMAARGVEYGVGTRNMFDLLGDDEEVDVNAKPKTVKKDEPSSKANKAPVVTSTKAPKTANKLSASMPPPDEPKRAPRPDDRANRNAANRPPRRGGRGAAGAAGGEGGSKKRQYDRRGPRLEGDQKQGAGKYNWGNEKDPLELAEEISGGAAGDAPRRGRGDRGDRGGGRGRGGRGRGGRGRGRGGRPEDQPADAAPKEGEDAPKPEDGQAPAEAAVEETVQEPADDEPKVKTFDEYLEEKKTKGVEDDHKREIRQPGEEQEGEWRSFVALPKEDEEKEEEDKASKPKKEKKAKQAVPKLSLDQFVGVQNARGRGGRGGRGGPRTGNQRAPADTEDNFPSLKR